MLGDGRLWAIAVLVGLTVLGYVVRVLRLAKLTSEMDEVQDFRNSFLEWWNSKGERQDIYQRLVMTGRGIQALVNMSGERYDYRAPFGRYVVANFQAIPNLIPEISAEFRDFALGPSLALDQKRQLVDDTLLRLLGFLDQVRESSRKKLGNPLSQFAAGVRFFVNLPAEMLSSIGIEIAPWPVFRVFGAFVGHAITLVTLVSGLVTIVVGWNDVKEMLHSVLHVF